MSITFFSSLFFSLLVSADYSTTIQPATKWGTWEGWGCSLCWWANVFGQRDDLADIVFSLKSTTLNGVNLPGLGMNIARYNAGGCSWNTVNGSSMVASPNIPKWKQIEGFWLNPTSSDPTSSSFNWSVDANQRAMMAKAKSRGANFIELFSNSPMWWMLTNHNPSGASNGNNDNLASAYYADFAIYMATIAKYAQDNWGITFDSVEPFNEPMGNWWTATGTQEGCHFATSTQATLVGLLRDEMNKRGLNSMKLAASDENTYDQATSTWNSFNATIQGDVGEVNVHGYQYGGGRRDTLYADVKGKRLWNSEYGEGDATGVSLMSNLNLDFRWLHNTAWCYWQPLDGGGWGLINSDVGAGTIGQPNPKYYVLAQYSRHIRPGTTIIDGGEANTIAALDSANKKLILVTANYGTAQTITYDLSLFTCSGPVTRWQTQTAGSEKYVQHTDVTLSGTSFKVSFTTNTIQTFEIQNCVPK